MSFIHCYIILANILWSIFTSIFMREIIMWLSFFIAFGFVASQEELGRVSTSAVFCSRLCRIHFNYFLNVW